MTNDKTRHTPSDQPEPMSDRVACVDYTVTEPAPSGKLTAYRWAGQASITPGGYVLARGAFGRGS